jgi:hypothetical protein
MGRELSGNRTKGAERNTFKHGARGTPLYRAWLHMRGRCHRKTDRCYKWYGARGITICDRWDEYNAFAADIGPHPGRGWTLDRIDVNGNYEPTNCRWVTGPTQQRNRRFCKITEEIAADIRRRVIKGVRCGAKRSGNSFELAKEFGVTQATIRQIARGVSWRP